MPNVFVTNFQAKNFTPAEKFGDIVFITKGFMPLDDMNLIRKKLEAYIDISDSSDFVILIGPTVILGMFTMLWAAKHGYMNLLSRETRI